MTWKTMLAGSAAAMLMLPLMASAHEDHGMKLGAFLNGSEHASAGLHLGSMIGVRAHDEATTTAKIEDRNDDRDGHRHATLTQLVASTTAARITAQAKRVLGSADFLGSLSANLASRIASSSLSASNTAAANAKLSDFNLNVANAKVQANAALAVAAQMGTTSASTTADLSAQAKGDLKSAREFLRAAIEDVRHMLGLIFKA